MSSLPGLLIEYFINGVIALFWIVVAFYPEVLDRTNSQLLVFIPLAYILGMLTDIIAYVLTLPIKTFIRARIDRKKLKIEKHTSGRNGTGNERDKKTFIEIQHTYPAIAKELTNRSSRDRIARGTIVNSIFASFFIPAISLSIGLTLIIASLIMWIIFEGQSHIYFRRAENVIKELETNPKQ